MGECFYNFAVFSFSSRHLCVDDLVTQVDMYDIMAVKQLYIVSVDFVSRYPRLLRLSHIPLTAVTTCK